MSKDLIGCWMPEDDEIGGNTYFKHPNCRQAINNICEKKGLKYLIEPNYASTGTCMYVRDLEQVEWLNPFSTAIPKADGICIAHDFMKENNIGIFMRVADCLALCIITESDVRVLHVSVESLNNGILMNLPLSSKDACAVLGPCICAEHLMYDLNDNRVGSVEALRSTKSSYEKFLARTSNYKVLGYDNFITIDNNMAHIDLKGIVKAELEKTGIDIIYDNSKCTVCDKLGSHRLGNGRANTIVVF